MCEYSDSTGYECPNESLKDSDYCIFHLQDDNKDIDEFNKGITEILEKEEDSINFHGFYFPPDTSDFSKNNFQKKIDFNLAIFSGEANFNGATFSGEAQFQHAIFSEKADFWKATFSRDAHFSYAIFSEKAEFIYAIFSGLGNFERVTFSEAEFSYAKFSGEANFSSAKFSGEANFVGITVSRDAYFGAIFSGEANFRTAIFLSDASFGYKFSGDAFFRDAAFTGEAYFGTANFAGKFEFIPKKSETIIFERAYFSDNVRIKTDMSKCSFADSNIERVDMTDSSWIRDDDKPKKSFSAFYERIRDKVGLSETSIIIWEEHQGELKSDWKELEGIYRRLKQSSQKFGDNSTAGKFYYQEMECRRKQLRGIKKLYWDVFYKELCGYGEKPFKVIWASLFLILLFAYSYLFSGIEFVGSTILNVPPNVIQYKLSLNSTGIQWLMNNFDSVKDDFLLCLYTSVITFTTLGYGDVRPIGLSRIFASLEAGLGIIMTALFIFVFSRRMLR